MTQRGATLFGCAIRVCCIGGVSTHPDYRKLGLASACFDDAAAKALRDGVDVMIVSGDRNLYRMRGCLPVGADKRYSLASDSMPAALDALSGGVSAERMIEAELPAVMECYRHEAVRFRRPLEDYRHALQSGWVMNRAAHFIVLRKNGAFRGYVILRGVEPNAQATLGEFAGDRHAILAALPRLMRDYALASLSFQALAHDSLLASLCAEVGLEGTPVSASGTVKLIHFPQLMERMRPRFEELIGAKTAASLRFGQEGEGYRFALGDSEIVLDRDTATYAVFGTLEGLPPAVQNLEGDLGEALRAILPLPTLWYGINYV
jgi:hypothetical protein